MFHLVSSSSLQLIRKLLMDASENEYGRFAGYIAGSKSMRGMTECRALHVCNAPSAQDRQTDLIATHYKMYVAAAHRDSMSVQAQSWSSPWRTQWNWVLFAKSVFLVRQEVLSLPYKETKCVWFTSPYSDLGPDRLRNTAFMIHFNNILSSTGSSFSRRWPWTLSVFCSWCRVIWHTGTNVSGERNISIFRASEIQYNRRRRQWYNGNI